MSCEEGVFLSSSKVSFEEGMRPSFEEDTLPLLLRQASFEEETFLPLQEEGTLPSSRCSARKGRSSPPVRRPLRRRRSRCAARAAMDESIRVGDE